MYLEMVIYDPYEEPIDPEVIVAADKETIREGTEKVMRKLKEMGLI